MTLTLVLIGIVLTLALAEKFRWGEKLGRVMGFAAPATVKQESSDTELAGWRCWRLNVERLELHSLHHSTTWDSAVLRAHELPAVENCAGVYAVADRAGLQFMLDDWNPYAAKSLSVGR